MFVSERKPLVNGNLLNAENFSSFGNVMPDGRLTDQKPMQIYRLREAILLSKQLGRPLTEEEMQKFSR